MKEKKQRNMSRGGVLYTRKVKAFTLIELLAVIVILAIIAVIATPIILGVINDSKYKAFKISLNNIQHAYELYATQNNIEPGTEIDISKLPLDSKNLKGKVFLNSEGKIELKEVTDGTYSAEGTLDDLSILKGTVEDLLENRLDVKVNVNTTAKSIEITVERIDGVPTSYSYEITGSDDYSDKVNNTTENTHTFDKLKINTDYTIKVTVKNKIGLTKEITKSVKTSKTESSIDIELSPKDEYIKEGTVTIKYTIKEEGLVGKYRWNDEEEFTPANQNTIEIPAKNGTLTAVIVDGEETIISRPIAINNVDTLGPTYTTLVSERNITITANDDKSGLHESAYSCDGTWQTSNVCKFTTEGNHTVNVRDVVGNEGTAKIINILVTSPALGNLTPVVYQNNNWVVADTTAKWYDYDKQEWANAVLLRTGVSKSIGQTVTVEGDNPEAIAMFVWIPRYEYKIEGPYGKGGVSAESPGEIEVNFISKDVVYENANSNGYRVHPAFTFDSQELSGIWVGKFETSHTTLSASTENNNLQCSNNNCASADGLRILPNVESLRWNDVSNTFYAIQSMDNRLKLSGDLHQMKNGEWGAVAYLAQSKYGINKEIEINDSSTYLTGDGDYVTNVTQSTTGNITGVYDMSGGAWEHVMAYYEPAYKTTPDLKLPWGSTSTTNYAGFTSQIPSKYYDSYTSTTSAEACGGKVCYGHSLSETAGWYGDYSYFVYFAEPWVNRGGCIGDGASAGVFASHRYYGDPWYTYSFRAVLAQTT